MVFLQPTYLWALLGLIIPVVIHFWSRKSFKTIPWGMIKFLPEESSRKAATLHWEDTLLFILRALSWIILIFALSQPVWLNNSEEKQVHRYLISPELVNESEILALLDTLSEEKAVQVLSEGFPDVQDFQISSNDSLVNYWSLLKLLPSNTTSAITVISHADFKNFQGTKPQLPFPVEWIIWPRNQEKYQALTLKKGALTGYYDKNNLMFVSNDQRGDPQGLTYNIRLKSKVVNDGVNALMSTLNDFVDVHKVERQPDILFAEPADSVLTGRVNFIISTNFPASGFWEINKNKYYIHPDAFKINNLIANDLVIRFSDILVREDILERDQPEEDIRQLSLSQIIPEIADGEQHNKKVQRLNISKYLWLLFILLLISERFYAQSRR